MMWKWDTNELVAFDKIHPTQYVFHEDTETFTIGYLVSKVFLLIEEEIKKLGIAN